MNIEVPLIDDRSFEDIVRDARALALRYCADTPWRVPEVTDSGEPGMAMIHLFAHLMEIIITRLNRVPEKHLLAFLDMMGTRLLPATSSRVLLQFLTAEGTTGNGFVPAATLVATEAAGGAEPLDFETCKDLVVTPVQLTDCFVIEPGADQYADSTAVVLGRETGGFEIFNGTQKVEHALYLGDDRLFGGDDAGATVTLRLSADNGIDAFTALDATWSYSAGDGAWVPFIPVSFEPRALGTQLDVIFPKNEDAAADTVMDMEKFWVRVNLETPINKQAVLPQLTQITGGVTSAGDGLVPEACFTNQLPIDPPFGFYPFGAQPTDQHFFYLGSSEVLSKTGADISIAFHLLETGTAGNVEPLELTWEYWDGKMWKPIQIIDDPGNHFTVNPTGTPDPDRIMFVCPEIEPRELNLQENHWIRVRISAGNYGEPMFFDLHEQVWKEGNLKPPKIGDIKLGYNYNVDSAPVETILFKNDFQYRAATSQSIVPFVPVTETENAFYMGFDRAFANDAVTLYFQVDEKDNPGLAGLDALVDGSGAVDYRRLQWEYYNGVNWARLNIVDETANLSQSGHIGFIGPEDFRSLHRFGLDRHWLRVRRETSGLNLPSPQLRRIFLNTVFAENARTITDEALGFSNGLADQLFTLKKNPVLTGQKIWVNEPEIPLSSEKAVIESEEGDDAVQVTRDRNGNVTDIRIRWHEVDNFFGSTPQSRHYVLESGTGEIRFGDGTNGMIPPRGSRVRCSLYRTGGGEEGNVTVGTVTQLKTSLPYIDSVTNVEPGIGGDDRESFDQFLVRGPQMLKHRDRAVTREDFQWLMREAPGDIAMSKCIPTTTEGDGGRVSVIIVPEMDHPRPYPTQAAMRRVEEFLAERSLVTLNSTDNAKIDVTGPGYMSVSVQAEIVPVDMNRAGHVEEAVVKNLETFFHPLTGGLDRTGWQFGRDVHMSEVMITLQSTEGVDFVKSVDIIVPIQLQHVLLNEGSAIDFDENSPVTREDGGVTMLLARGIEINDDRFILKGFKEGDGVALIHKDDPLKRVELEILSVDGGNIRVTPFALEESFPAGSRLERGDGLVASLLTQPLAVGGGIGNLVTDTLNSGDVVGLKYGSPERTMSFTLQVLEGIELSRIYVDPRYLVYSGNHKINMVMNND